MTITLRIKQIDYKISFNLLIYYVTQILFEMKTVILTFNFIVCLQVAGRIVAEMAHISALFSEIPVQA